MHNKYGVSISNNLIAMAKVRAVKTKRKGRAEVTRSIIFYTSLYTKGSNTGVHIPTMKSLTLTFQKLWLQSQGHMVTAKIYYLPLLGVICNQFSLFVYPLV